MGKQLLFRRVNDSLQYLHCVIQSQLLYHPLMAHNFAVYVPPWTSLRAFLSHLHGLASLLCICQQLDGDGPAVLYSIL